MPHLDDEISICMSLRQSTLHSLRRKSVCRLNYLFFWGGISFYSGDEHFALLIRWSSVPQVSGKEET